MKTVLAVALAVAWCFQVVWGQCASFEQLPFNVFEDIGLEDLALRVCIDPVQDCEVELVTEPRSATVSEANSGSAVTNDMRSIMITDTLEFSDYEPVRETLQLTANTRECVGIIIEEDTNSEGDEKFDVVLFDDTGSEFDRREVTLFDEEDVSFVYFGDTPEVLDNFVTLNLSLGRAVDQAECSVLFREDIEQTVDCTSGSASFSLPSRNGLHSVLVTTSGSDFGSFIDERNFRLDQAYRYKIFYESPPIQTLALNNGVNRRCSVVLINQGVVVESSDVTFNFGLTASANIDTSEIFFICNLFDADTNVKTRVDGEVCASPFQIPNLDPGNYILRIIPRDPQDECSRTLRNVFDFSIA